MSEHTHSKPRRLNRRQGFAAAAAGLLVVGGAAGAVAVAATRPSVTMAPATPVAIRSLQSEGIVTIRGNVAEVYGNKFVMADQTGRALVDTGREGEDGRLVPAGQPITVQGRFDHGFVRAAFLVGADGKVVSVGPLGEPHGGPGERRHDGPRGHGPDGGPDGGRDGGPDGERNAPPPPPPAALAGTAATQAPAGTAAQAK